jgi:Bacteriophage Lambda NinG protein
MILSKKPAKCRHCKEREPELPRGYVIHAECVDAWLAANKPKLEAMTAKAHRAAAKKERAQVRQRREAIKTIPDLIKEAQVAFNAYIRFRDHGESCICCGHPLGAGEVGGAYDCGHYRSTGSASHLRFDERNAHAQRKHCNRYGAGRAVDYRIGLAQRIGIEAVEALEADNKPHKWQRDELIAIRATYKAKLKELKERE